MIRPPTNRNNSKCLICQLGLGVFCESSVGMSSKPNGPTAQPWRQCPKRRRRALVRADLINAPLQVKSRKNNWCFCSNQIYCPLNKIRPNQLLWQFSHELQPSLVDYVAHPYHFHTIRGANPIWDHPRHMPARRIVEKDVAFAKILRIAVGGTTASKMAAMILKGTALRDLESRLPCLRVMPGTSSHLCSRWYLLYCILLFVVLSSLFFSDDLEKETSIHWLLQLCWV